MKRSLFLIAIILIAVSATVVFASGTVWSEVIDNVAYVHHDDAYFNCCPTMEFEYTYHVDTLLVDIWEEDLDLYPCDCMCNFDFTHRFEGLPPGTYLAKVWEDNKWSTNGFELAGETIFTIDVHTGQLSEQNARSPCGGWSWITEDPLTPRNVESFTPEVSGLPASISYFLNQPSYVSIDIHDISGKQIREIDLGRQDFGEHSYKWDGADNSGNLVPRGIYFVLLRIGNQTHSLPLIVLR